MSMTNDGLLSSLNLLIEYYIGHSGCGIGRTQGKAYQCPQDVGNDLGEFERADEVLHLAWLIRMVRVLQRELVFGISEIPQ